MLKFLCVGLALFVTTACAEETEAPKERLNSLESIQILKPTGETFRFEKNEKAWVVNLWATWCAPCVQELPDLQKLAQQGMFNVVAVSMDVRPDIVQKFMMKNALNDLPVAFDEFGREFGSKLGVQKLPHTFILDENLNIVGEELGAREWGHPMMIEKIKTYLKKK